MYETLEHWKQYKQEKELQTKIAKEFKLPTTEDVFFDDDGNGYVTSDNSSKLTPLEYEWLLDELCTKEMSAKEFDKELDKLAKRL